MIWLDMGMQAAIDRIDEAEQGPLGVRAQPTTSCAQTSMLSSTGPP
jgi:hypothetical protein